MTARKDLPLRLALCALLLFPLNALGQLLNGLVYDAVTGDPMPGVVVEVPGQHMLVTDAQGRYSTMLSVADDSLTCYFSYYG